MLANGPPVEAGFPGEAPGLCSSLGWDPEGPGGASSLMEAGKHRADRAGGLNLHLGLSGIKTHQEEGSLCRGQARPGGVPSLAVGPPLPRLCHLKQSREHSLSAPGSGDGWGPAWLWESTVVSGGVHRGMWHNRLERLTTEGRGLF